ncbi:MAG TPA: hypothetical protein VN843_18875 [Anaerolineales bacterium]|nr:hypothetical protein [Anaerolineales bacterium]
MSRLNKLISVTILVLFILACNFVTQPIRDVQNVAGTAQSFASALPVETLQALASQIPAETLQALPSAIPSFEALATEFGNMFNPQGTPVESWNDIPIMPEATSGQEFDEKTYSFKTDATVQEVQNYYSEQLPGLGWNQTFNVPADANGGVSVYSKGSNILTLTITAMEGSTVVILTLV